MNTRLRCQSNMRAVRCASWLFRPVGEGAGAAVGFRSWWAHRPSAEGAWGGEGVVDADLEHGMQARHPGPQWWVRYMLLVAACCRYVGALACNGPASWQLYTKWWYRVGEAVDHSDHPCLTEAPGGTTACYAHSIRSAVRRSKCNHGAHRPVCNNASADTMSHLAANGGIGNTGCCEAPGMHAVPTLTYSYQHTQT